MRRQQGMVFLVFVVVLAVIGIAMVMGASALQAQGASNRVTADRQLYLSDAARALREWYQIRLGTVDAMADAPAVATVLDQAGISRRFGLRAVASTRIVTGEVAYRVFVLWLPAIEPDPSLFDVTTGQFTPGPGVPFEIISGQALQAQGIADTRRTMTNVAVSLENYFGARYESGGRDVRVNQFRPDATCTALAGGIPCLDTYTAASTVDWVAAGLGGIATTDAWGNSLEVSNLQDSQTTAPPYSIAIRSRTPFGTFLTMNAIQRL